MVSGCLPNQRILQKITKTGTLEVDSRRPVVSCFSKTSERAQRIGEWALMISPFTKKVTSPQIWIYRICIFFRPNGNKRLTAFLPCLPSLPSSNWGSDCICLPHEHNTSCSVNERDTLQVIGTEIRTSSNARISALIVGCGTSTCGFKGARPYLGKVTVYNTATSYNKNKMHK